MLARRGSPRDLQVNDGFGGGEIVALQQFAGDGGEVGVSRSRDAQCLQAAIEAVPVFARAEEVAAIGAEDFVSAVGEEERAVVGRDAGLVLREELAVEIDSHGGWLKRESGRRATGKMAEAAFPTRILSHGWNTE